MTQLSRLNVTVHARIQEFLLGAFYPNILQRGSNGLFKLEDLKVLRRSPDLLNNVKKGQG